MEGGYREEGYLASVDGVHVALSHCAMKCLGSCSFNTGVFQVRPTEYELAHLGCTVAELCDVAVRIGWLQPAGQDATVQRFARVSDFQEALRAAGVQPKRTKAELLAQVTQHCPEWLAAFARRNPAFTMLDKGVIELQAHRDRLRPPSLDHTKDGHRALMLSFLARHVADAQQPGSRLLGFKVAIREDWPRCDISARFHGVFLADELPDLYPVDCPDESACACVLYNAIICGDGSREAALLEQRHLARFGRSPCPHWTGGPDGGHHGAAMVERKDAALPAPDAPSRSVFSRLLAWIDPKA